jgi:hypothetical protein
MTGAVLFVSVLALGLLAPLIRYRLVQSEADNTDRMHRADAERAARRDTPERERDWDGRR